MKVWEKWLVVACVVFVAWAWLWPERGEDDRGVVARVPQEVAEAAPPPKPEVGQVGTIVSITAYLTDADLSDNKASAGVYDAAGNLLGVTIEKGAGEMTGGGEWVTFVFATPLDVSDVEQVRLAVFGNYEEVGYAAPGPDVSFDTNAVYGGVDSWPSYVDPPEEFGWFEENKVFSIYAVGGNGARIGTESASETGFYTEGEKVCATGLLDTAPLDNGDVELDVTETIGVADSIPAGGPGGGGGFGIGITAAETIAADDAFRRASPCWGRYRDPTTECSNYYRDDDQQAANLYREV